MRTDSGDFVAMCGFYLVNFDIVRPHDLPSGRILHVIFEVMASRYCDRTLLGLSRTSSI
jgi:hypothetical protein